MAPIGVLDPLGPKPWRRQRLHGLDTRLPPSVQRSPRAPPPRAPRPNVLKPDQVASAYHWRPMQAKEHQQSSDMSYTTGTYVDTLVMKIANNTYEGSTSHFIRLENPDFTAKGSLWCYLVGGSFVICKGTIVGSCERLGEPMPIARLPEKHRPRHTMRFAALAREAYNLESHVSYTSHLVTFIVSPDGYLNLATRHRGVVSIDLSAIRFCTTGGISLIDNVTLHSVDVAGSRLVTLQGSLTERFFMVHSVKPLALLPESCRPQCELPFIVSGSKAVGYHLLVACPLRSMGCGGELYWRDGMWNHDEVHFSGMMYEVSKDVVHVSTLDSRWTGESLTVFVKDFQNFLIRKFGSIENAWQEAFDTDGSGSVNFTEFGLGCKASGYVGNATRLWAALDEDRSGEISLEELGTGVDSSQLVRPQERLTTIELLQSVQNGADNCLDLPLLGAPGPPNIYDREASI